MPGRKKKGRRSECSIVRCVRLQDTYSDCKLCDIHSKNCTCKIHTRKRKASFNKQNKESRKKKKEKMIEKLNATSQDVKTGQPRTSPESIYFDPDYSHPDYYHQDPDQPSSLEPAITLDPDAKQYLNLLHGKVTNLGPDMVCIPDVFFDNRQCALNEIS